MEKLNGGSLSGTSVSKKICAPNNETKEDNQKKFQERNPLDIPEIVAIVAGHLSEVGDLKSIRTQSKAWRDETFLKWRSSAVFLITDETIPILVKAFGETDLTNLSEEEKAAALTEKDPFRLQEVPFQKYRFASMRGGQPWTYPLVKIDLEGNMIWEKVINLHASYLDVGECVLKKCNILRNKEQELYLPGLKWIFEHCSNVTHLAMAPFITNDSEMFLKPEEEDEGLGPLTVQQKQMKSKVISSFTYPPWMQGNFPGIPAWTIHHRPRDFKVSYPKITSFAISTPQKFQNQSCLKPLLEGSEGQQGYHFGKLIIGKMIHLKHLTLPTGGGATSLLKGLRDSPKDRQDIQFDLLRDYEVPRPIKLESLTAFASQKRHCLHQGVLNSFSDMFNSPLTQLRQLCLSLSSNICVNESNFITGMGIYHVLNLTKSVLEKLELEVDCDEGEEDSCSLQDYSTPNADQLEFALQGCVFSKLTHFKVTLDYKTFPGRLGTTDLNYLKRMPKIQEYYFGMKKVERDWVIRKLEFVDDGVVMLEELIYLKSFHFHGNFTKESLCRLGGLMRHLSTLEVVLDEENFQIVGEIWPGLNKLKLLEGSDVPDELLSTLKMANPSLEYE